MNLFVERMKFIKANNIFSFILFSYLLSPYKSNLVLNVSSRFRIFESNLQISYMRFILGVMKCRKKLEGNFVSRPQEERVLIVFWKL